ncbi:hypothetical protein ACE6HX_15810 [Bacillus pumilus]|uniref:hypothetical protein n=1 Tax=Bacillus pumilus TaxID=1408 RepID=UPI0035D031EC
MDFDLERNFLVKFIEPQFTESTLDGDLFFKRNGHFIELEEKQLKAGIGDKREGAWTRVLDPGTNKMIIITENGQEIPLNFKKGVFRTSYSNLKHLPICCFVSLNLGRDFDIDMENNNATLKENLNIELVNQFAGRDLIFFANPEELIKRVHSACDRDDMNLLRGLVKYYDDKNEPHPLSEKDYDEAPHKGLLYKRKFFEFQREYRIVLKKILEDDYILNIGTLRDIAYNLGPVNHGEDLFKIKISKQKKSKGLLE